MKYITKFEAVKNISHFWFYQISYHQISTSTVHISLKTKKLNIIKNVVIVWGLHRQMHTADMSNNVLYWLYSKWHYLYFFLSLKVLINWTQMGLGLEDISEFLLHFTYLRVSYSVLWTKIHSSSKILFKIQKFLQTTSCNLQTHRQTQTTWKTLKLLHRLHSHIWTHLGLPTNTITS
jgi:hypothetical protein